MRRVRYLLLALLVVVVAAIAGGYYWLHSGNPDALRKIVLQQCVPNQQQHQNPAPCAEVNLKGGYVLFKDRNGPLQYLLMPTYRINGTESPLLLNPLTPNFFWQAWQGREIMSQHRGSAVSDDAVSLTINSRSGRTQNHFHIHISCRVPMSVPSWTRTRPLSAAAGCRCPVDYWATNIWRVGSPKRSWRSAARS